MIKDGFVLNPYDACVANKEINGSQCTIIWHVDDLKISHNDPKVVDSVLAWLEKLFGKLVTRRGKKHTYLGMDLDFTESGSVKVSMIDYLKELIVDFPVEIEDSIGTPIGTNLLEINEEDPVYLEEERAKILHTFVAKLLFVCKRSRPDTQVAVAFLTTRVRKPDEDDWKKLIRLVKYIKSTVEMKLTLSSNNTNIVKWWVDGSYAVHKDMKSHTGGLMTLGKGCVYGTSIRQKLNTKSSTESELVATADVLPQIILTSYFLKEQGCRVEKSVLYQDNQSAILLEKNGKASSGKRTRHINIRYFFIKDRIDKGEVEVVFCPTEEMVGDFFTKPLQGAKFRKFRKIIMNLADDGDF